MANKTTYNGNEKARKTGDNMTDIIGFGISVGNRISENESWIMSIEKDIGGIENQHDYTVGTMDRMSAIIHELGNRVIALEKQNKNLATNLTDIRLNDIKNFIEANKRATVWENKTNDLEKRIFTLDRRLRGEK